MRADLTPPLTSQSAHPLQRMYLKHAEGDLVLPDLESLNRQARAMRIQTGGGFQLQFDSPDDAADYELRAFHSGIVATRPGNWHDAFNALVWLTFPLTKQALNLGHLQARALQSVAEVQGKKQRGRIGDALTQFDECGVVVVGCSTAATGLWHSICRHEWVDVFARQRPELLETTRFIVFGHGSLDALRAPFIGLCGKAIYLEAERSDFAAIDAGDFSGVDVRLSRRVTSTNWSAMTAEGLTGPMKLPLQPLPLLGIPGATADNDSADYYRDQRQFRPRR